MANDGESQMAIGQEEVSQMATGHDGIPQMAGRSAMLCALYKGKMGYVAKCMCERRGS